MRVCVKLHKGIEYIYTIYDNKYGTLSFNHIELPKGSIKKLTDIEPEEGKEITILNK